jgi:hypothetical protein
MKDDESWMPPLMAAVEKIKRLVDALAKIQEEKLVTYEGTSIPDEVFLSNICRTRCSIFCSWTGWSRDTHGTPSARANASTTTIASGKLESPLSLHQTTIIFLFAFFHSFSFALIANQGILCCDWFHLYYHCN